MREIGLGVELGREETSGGGGEESALEFPDEVPAAFGAGFGAPGGTKGDNATEDKPVTAARPFQKGAAVAKRRLGRRFDHARAMADRLGVPDVHTDYRELCAREDLDGVTITTPKGTA